MQFHYGQTFEFEPDPKMNKVTLISMRTDLDFAPQLVQDHGAQKEWGRGVPKEWSRKQHRGYQNASGEPPILECSKWVPQVCQLVPNPGGSCGRNLDPLNCQRRVCRNCPLGPMATHSKFTNPTETTLFCIYPNYR